MLSSEITRLQNRLDRAMVPIEELKKENRELDIQLQELRLVDNENALLKEKNTKL